MLKNGSRANDLKSCNITDFGKFVLSNTCAFDTVSSIFMVSYCDSNMYSKEIKRLDIEIEFLNFITSIIQNGITANTFKNRAQILLSMIPEMNQVEYDTTFIACYSTVSEIIKKLCADISTVIDNTSCSNYICKNNRKISKPVPYITLHTINNELLGLQEFVSERFNEDTWICQLNSSGREFDECKDVKEIETISSKLHLLIEVLKWEDIYYYY